MLSESVLVSLAGGVMALILAPVAKQAVFRMLAPISEMLPNFDFRTDIRVLAFTLAVSLATAILAGLVPAVRAAGQDPATGLAESGARGVPRLRLGRALVAAQVALSLFLLVGAGLLLRTLVSLWRVDPGFRVDNLLVFRLNASTAGYTDQRLVGFYERARESLASIPGVRGVTMSDASLLGGRYSATGFSMPGRKGRPGEHMQASLLRVGDSFLGTMGIPLLVGRDFGPADAETAPKVAIINETLARAFFVKELPLGQIVRIGETDHRILGVCRDAKYESLADSSPAIYLPYRQHAEEVGPMYFELRTAMPPLSLARAVRRRVAGLDTNVPLTALNTQAALMERSMLPHRLLTVLCGSFAALALVLSTIGLYGVTAYGVTRRTPEIGVRMALGANRGEVLWMVLREALTLAVVGLGLGLPASIAAVAWARSALFGVLWTDPGPLAGAAGLLLLVSAAAALAPALRASRIAPTAALRCE